MDTTRRPYLAMLAVLLLAAACTTETVSPSTSDSRGTPAPATQSSAPSTTVLGFHGLPIDPSLTPLSLSHLSPEAEAALDLCVSPAERSKVAGGAHLASAHDVGRYMPTNGNEPELRGDVPVWLFQLTGPVVTTARGGPAIDPMCMVRGGEPVMYGPYDADGSPIPFPGIRYATMSLPPLVP